MAIDAAGTFKFPVLPIGNYRIEAAFSGFQRIVVLDVVIESDRTNLVRVDRTSAASTSRVTAKEIGNVAVSTGSYVPLLTFMPGALTTNVNGSLAEARAQDGNPPATPPRSSSCCRRRMPTHRT